MIIDSHVHFIGESVNNRYLDWLEKTGNQDYGPLFLWNNPAFGDFEKHIQEMDRYGIDKSVITFSANIVQVVFSLYSETQNPAQVISELNDAMYTLYQKYPTRVIPCAYIDPGLSSSMRKEISKASARNFGGLSVLCAYKKDHLRFLENDEYDFFWKLAEESGLPVFIHFSNLYRIDEQDTVLHGTMSDTLLYAGIGQLMENAICAARLILNGTFLKYPKLKVVLGQLGGTLPFMIERCDMLYTMYAGDSKAKGLDVTNPDDFDCFMRKVSDFRQHIYVDTHSMSKTAIEAVCDILGEDHILYGSDYPITPAVFGRGHGIAEIEHIEEKRRKKIFAENAVNLMKL